jgi:CBS-domain-containing membrane protein
METKKAGEIMVPLDRYPHIPYWFTIRQTIAEMETAEISKGGKTSIPRVLLVFDEAYRLMGFVRRRDILRGLLPSFFAESKSHLSSMFDLEVDPNLSEVFSGDGADQMRELAEKQVSSIMNPIVHIVDHEDHLLKVIHDIVVNNYYMLPVSKDGKIVGVIRTMDAMHHIASVVL